MTNAKTCPIHGWVLIQKFREARKVSPLATLVEPINEWWCSECGYDVPVAEMNSVDREGVVEWGASESAANTPGEPPSR